VLEQSGSWCFLLVGAREIRGLVLSASWSLQNRGSSLTLSWCSKIDDVQNLKDYLSFEEEEVFSLYGFPRENLSLCISYV
jgi:hypothetical protein